MMKSQFNRLFWDRAGGVVPLVALAALPLMTGVGMAVDYTRASAAKTALQSATDSAALLLYKKAALQNANNLQATATAYVTSILNHPGIENLNISATYTSSGGSKVVVNATADVPTQFMGLVGFTKIAIASSSTSVWGNTRLRVALVLDNTGSMAQSGKMDALKTASHNLLTQLQSAATYPEDVYISVIPFNKDVNVGASNNAASWVRWDLWEADNGSCSKSKYGSQSQCTSNGGKWTPASHSTWNGCVTDRDQNFDTTNDAPVAGATLYPAEQYSSCPTQLMALSNDWTALSAKIDAMQPVGNTNQAIGLQMGWQSLTEAPFTIPTQDPDYKYMQLIILLTDGLNTEDRWYTSERSIDNRQQTTCTNVKAAGITVYTVQVNTGGDPTSSLLKSCASDATKFFLLTSSDQIISTFQQIGTALSQLHLSM
jgi:Flp pilus assembly protein TadG